MKLLVVHRTSLSLKMADLFIDKCHKKIEKEKEENPQNQADPGLQRHTILK